MHHATAVLLLISLPRIVSAQYEQILKNPNVTRAATFEVNRMDLKAADIPKLRLVENWFWDERKQRLIIRLERFAPVIESAETGWSLSKLSRPLFYRRVK